MAWIELVGTLCLPNHMLIAVTMRLSCVLQFFVVDVFLSSLFLSLLLWLLLLPDAAVPTVLKDRRFYRNRGVRTLTLA